MKRGLERLDFKLTVCKEIKSFTSFKSWYHAAELLTDIVNQNDVLINYFERRLRES